MTEEKNLIIGGGAAGLMAGIFSARSGRNTVIAEKKLGMLEDEKRTGKWTIAKIKGLTLTISADTVM